VMPGLACTQQEPAVNVAAATVRCLRRNVPAAVAGVAFLSGGQTGELATARLNAMNAGGEANGRSPWPLVFSFGRALQQPALGIWSGEDANVVAAQHALLHRARCNHAALRGAYEDSVVDKPILRLAS
jgi:fructose-bisphosphate aldolase class I